MKITSASVSGAKCRSSRASASNGFYVTQKQERRLPSCAIISSTFIPSIGKGFMGNGSKTFAIGASAGRFGGDIGYRPGIGNRSQTSRLRVATARLAEIRSQTFPRSTSGRNRRKIPRIGRRTRTRLTPGFPPGFGPTKQWMRKHGRNFIRRQSLSPRRTSFSSGWRA